jgi:hypothetical protein
MKNNKLNIILAVIILLSSCVQKTYRKTVVFLLQTDNVKHLEKVGIRGNEKPLNWDSDVEMTTVVQDSLYKATVTFITGYKFTEVKFVINDKIELENKDNRKVTFSENDTTIYKAKFDTINP